MGGLDRMILSYQENGTATGDQAADRMLKDDGGALIVGVLLDQQVRAEVAFSGPYKIRQRLGHFDLDKIARMEPDVFEAIMREKPAVHRYASMMGSRIQALAKTIVDQYSGNADLIWEGPEEEIRKRALALPGFGKAKVETLLNALSFFGHRPDIGSQYPK